MLTIFGGYFIAFVALVVILFAGLLFALLGLHGLSGPIFGIGFSSLMLFVTVFTFLVSTLSELVVAFLIGYLLLDRKERLNQLIYVNVLNCDHLPVKEVIPTPSVNYLPPSQTDPSPAPGKVPEVISPLPSQPEVSLSAPQDVLVIGGGLAGLIAAWRSTINGCKTRLSPKAGERNIGYRAVSTCSVMIHLDILRRLLILLPD